MDASVPGVKLEAKEEDIEERDSTTPDPLRADSSHEDLEDDEIMPDYPVDDPRYQEWVKRMADKNTAEQKPALPVSGAFRPFIQRSSKPHFDVKSEQQAACGPHVLGFDEQGSSIEIPASINRFLRGYQREGVAFFWKHYQKREGGLLGDDMGQSNVAMLPLPLPLPLIRLCRSRENDTGHIIPCCNYA